MKKIHLLFIATAFIAACNNESREKIDATTDTLAVLPSKIADSTVISNSLAVSEIEMKDDSVFADGSIPTSWENVGITDVKGLKLFLKQAQQWVMNNDKEKLAAAVKYPLKDIKNETELVAAYDKVFTKAVKLSFATINFNQIFRNQKGVMLENGKVWINQFGKEFKIYSIN